MQLEELVNTHYDVLNENDKVILETIMKDKSTFLSMKSEALAASLHVSRATLLRLCRKLGLVSFSDLKLLLEEKQERKAMSQLDIFDTYHTMIDELKKFSYEAICQLLYESETIYIYGTGNEQKTLATECKRIFLTAGKCVVDLFDLGEIEFMKPSFHKSDVFIIISLSGETPEGIQVLHAISTTEIQTISITRLQNNTISHLCDHHMYVATKTIEHTANTYELVSAFYVLMDLLFIHYLNYVREVSR